MRIVRSALAGSAARPYSVFFPGGTAPGLWWSASWAKVTLTFASDSRTATANVVFTVSPVEMHARYTGASRREIQRRGERLRTNRRAEAGRNDAAPRWGARAARRNTSRW